MILVLTNIVHHQVLKIIKSMKLSVGQNILIYYDFSLNFHFVKSKKTLCKRLKTSFYSSINTVPSKLFPTERFLFISPHFSMQYARKAFIIQSSTYVVAFKKCFDNLKFRELSLVLLFGIL